MRRLCAYRARRGGRSRCRSASSASRFQEPPRLDTAILAYSVNLAYAASAASPSQSKSFNSSKVVGSREEFWRVRSPERGRVLQRSPLIAGLAMSVRSLDIEVPVGAATRSGCRAESAGIGGGSRIRRGHLGVMVDSPAVVDVLHRLDRRPSRRRPRLTVSDSASRWLLHASPNDWYCQIPAALACRFLTAVFASSSASGGTGRWPSGLAHGIVPICVGFAAQILGLNPYFFPRLRHISSSGHRCGTPPSKLQVIVPEPSGSGFPRAD